MLSQLNVKSMLISAIALVAAMLIVGTGQTLAAGETVRVKIDFSETQNALQEIALGNGQNVAENTFFNVMQNGTVLTDPTLRDNEHSLAVRRWSDQAIEFMSHGRFDSNSTAKHVGHITIEGGRFTHFENVPRSRPTGLTGPEYSAAANGESIPDSFQISSDGRSANFSFLFSEPGDGVTIFYTADTSNTQCSDNADNDGDGFEDAADPDCYDSDGNYNPDNEEDTDNSHNQCVDKKDNDGDELIDFSDPDCHTDNNATDGDDTFDPTRKENKKQGQVAAVIKPVPVAIQPVPVTAKTGMSLPVVSLAAAALGTATVLLRRYLA